MGAVSSCCGGRRKEPDVEQGLLAEYHEETGLQHRVHEKMHTYQMLRALADGYMPSNEQLIANLRTLLAADVLNPQSGDVSDAGQRLTEAAKHWLKDFMHLLQDKNAEDQVEDFIWALSKSDLSVNTQDAARRAKSYKAKANASAVYDSFRTVGTLLLSNPDFRTFLDDLHTIGRHVFAETAQSASHVAYDAGKKLQPSRDSLKALKKGETREGDAPGKEDLAAEAKEVSEVVGDGAVKVAKESVDTLKDDLSGDTRETLLQRLKTTVVNLRQRKDYSESVSTISRLIQRYAEAYSRAADQTVAAIQEDVHTNDALDNASRKFWSLLRSFGDAKEWDALEEKFKKLAEHSKANPDFEKFARELGQSIERLLSDPDFFDQADDKFKELQDKAKEATSESTLRQDVDAALAQSRRTLQSVFHDENVARLHASTTRIFSLLFPGDGQPTNPDLTHDALNAFLPALVTAVQRVPIPRLELSTPDVDLLLESLVLEPGRTVNRTSFLPHRLHLTTRTELDVRAARVRTVSSATTILTLTVSGLTLRAEDVGFWLRLHSGLLRYTASGLAGARLDGTGLELQLEVAVHRGALENVLTLRRVQVRAPTLDFNLAHPAPPTANTWALPWLVALTKPLVRPLVRHALERGLADAVADGCRFLNREIVFARERLRATRVADPQDLLTFVRAVAARWAPEDDPDTYVGVGLRPSKGVFRGVYAPGSVARVWEEEGRRAAERIERHDREGWRNDIFDVAGTSTNNV